MYNPSVLIISKRRELAVRYKKILKLLQAHAVLTDKLSDAIGKIRDIEFEFIIISDTIEGSVSDFIKKVRILTCNFRPTIIAVSKSAELSDKLELLNSGADDFLSEAMPNREFQARLNAHIRRHVESLTNPLTGFLEEKLTLKTLKQAKGKNAALILLSVDGIECYREIYGEIAACKVYQTLGAIISSALSKDDTIGHLRESEFLIFTDFYKAEKLAEFLAFAFDNILKRFYSEFDFANNFTIFSSNSKEERKIPLMKLIEAVIEFDDSHLSAANELLQFLYNMLKPLKNAEKSTYIIDRPKLNGKVDDIGKNKILIMESDEALGLLIETTCAMNGYDAKICKEYQDFKNLLCSFLPDLIIIDYGSELERQGLYALDEAKKYYKAQKRKMPVVIFSTNIPDKKTILSRGADFYLPKPYDVHLLIKTINEFLNY
ncbi:MAG: hypothetical protein LUE64_04255 [Candidatus Gastranaerophilales bacterium]|nr:hypothetical protein [Candidatus Gastranaerophilales bacterium]